MLKSFRVNNFKSLLNIEFKPSGSNLIIGPNNSGKTNLCSAINFLSLTSKMPLDMAIQQAVGETWNISNVYAKNDILEIELSCLLPHENYQIQFDYNLKILVNNNIGRQNLILKEEMLKASGSGLDQTILLENNNGRVRLFFDNRYPDIAPVEVSYPTDCTMLYRLYDIEAYQWASVFKKYLGSWGYFNFVPWILRSPNVYQGATLFPNGSNLNLVLYTLHNENPRLEKKIIEALELLEPKLDYFTFMSPKPDIIYYFIEDKYQNKFSAQSISDGTLRYLAMIYLIYSTACSEGSNQIKPLYIIEEPENGIYVGHLKSL